MQLEKMQQGVTLVESLVAAIIAVVIGIIIFTIFSMFSLQQKESIEFMRMQRQYETVDEQVAFNVRQAARVLGVSEAFTKPFQCFSDTAKVKQISMFNDTGAKFAAYRIVADRFEESLSGGWKAFSTGGTVLVDAASRFWLSPCRNQVDLHIRIKGTIGDSTIYLPMRKDSYQCRNQ